MRRNYFQAIRSTATSFATKSSGRYPVLRSSRVIRCGRSCSARRVERRVVTPATATTAPSPNLSHSDSTVERSFRRHSQLDAGELTQNRRGQSALMPPPGSLFKWCHEEEVKLIDFYRENDILWNLGNPNYFKRDKREKVFSFIVDGMSNLGGRQFTVKDVKKKILNLRTTFGRELRKIKNSERLGGGEEDIYESGWTHFHRLSFLRPHTRSGDAMDPVNDLSAMKEGGSDHVMEESQSEGEKSEIPSHSSQRPFRRRALQTSQIILRRRLPPEASSDSSPSCLETQKKKKKSRRKAEGASKEDLMRAAIDALKRKDRNTDGLSLFFDSVAHSIRTLPLIEQERCKLKIQQVVFECLEKNCQ
ncbi:uncharacterized protein LOC124168062 [Ischnura elegans]|uniref:uncharacterized protein LOC124168062 n=1 Tax=Ischnura elegans TaxID=197161 RepID=UPI001ED8B239|nr:uncharacterized protein LOC124168062 [Ischnura elegans]